jgi:hypothetical protein
MGGVSIFITITIDENIRLGLGLGLVLQVVHHIPDSGRQLMSASTFG